MVKLIVKNSRPVDVVVKVMTSNRSAGDVYDFFQDVRNWESGGIITSAIKDKNNWWSVNTPAGKAKIKCIPDKHCQILDHTFILGDVIWNVYVRIMANNKGSTTVWTFLKPNGLTVKQFREQLKTFDLEIHGWRRRLEIKTNKGLSY
jgi:hypothetical protein